MREQENREELFELSERVRELVRFNHIEESKKMVVEAMGEYPDAAEPHNLYGILMERMGEHVGAMKHFRAAWALDPTYEPAKRNMERFGSFQPTGTMAFNETDCEEELKKQLFKVEYDTRGIGHVVRR